MDIEEARKKYVITDEERLSVDKYINFGHEQINALCDFNVQDYLSASEKGWYLIGVKQDKSSEEIGGDILTSINDIANIYSAMCKYKFEAPIPTKVLRGTSSTEAKRLSKGKMYNKILSTTTNEITAKSFGDPYGAALLRISLDANIPYINVTDFVGKNNLSRYEDEYILSPFTKIKKANFSSNYNGYSYYDVELGKPELRQFEEGDKEKLAKYIKDNFSKIIRDGKEYKDLTNELERLKRFRNNTTDKEEIDRINKRQEDIYNKIKEITTEEHNFSNNLKMFIQGLCLEKEKEFLDAQKTIDKEREEKIGESIRKYIEDERKKEIDYFSTSFTDFTKRSKFLPELLQARYDEIKKEEAKFYSMASLLGIPFNLKVDDSSIQNNIETARKNVNLLKQKLEEKGINENTSYEDVKAAKEMITEYSRIINESMEKGIDLNVVIYQYKNDCILNMKKEIDIKAQELIKKSRLEKLQKKKEMIKDKRISFFGRLRGLDKLKALELENVDLEMQMIKNSEPIQKANYSIHDTLSDIKVFCINECDRQMNPEMTQFFDSVEKVFKVNDKKIDNAVEVKLNSHPVVITNKKKREKTSDKIYRISEENNSLKNSILEKMQQSNYRANNSVDINSSTSKFSALTESVVKITTLEHDSAEVSKEL